MAVNPQHLGTDGYSSSAILSMNANGQGLMGIDGIFAGNDMDAGTCGIPASNLTCNKTPMFKLTDDFGESWSGNHGSFGMYYVPDAVFNDIFTTFPNEVVSDECTGLTEDVVDFWSWYEFDMRVDVSGNPHIVVSIVAETASQFVFIDGKTGFLVNKVEEWKKFIIQLIENPGLRKTMGENGRERVEKLFSVNVNKKNYLKVFDLLKIFLFYLL